MPNYEYICPECGLSFEHRKGFDDPDPFCEMCGCSVDQVISVPSLQFKGSGFYITDYKKKAEGK